MQQMSCTSSSAWIVGATLSCSIVCLSQCSLGARIRSEISSTPQLWQILSFCEPRVVLASLPFHSIATKCISIGARWPRIPFVAAVVCSLVRRSIPWPRCCDKLARELLQYRAKA
ncbi:hypothetical protein BCV70DRAFT_90653 [Testicularia cyperi]|uniref:Secreted protein n=1 Tax=Testicularia cyperi TaxID=1882483 RepID=A0A317XS29_9BASI|nr:hypothetical protein BCV70DRAFT_90653 [Testicularia cyperi]